MLKLLYWTCVAVDLAAVLLFFVLGLAAAGSSKTSPAMVALVMLGLPALPLAVSLWLYLRSTSPLARGLAFALAAAPLAIVLAAKTINDLQVSASTNPQGELTFFRSGPQRALAEAIQRNDAAAVAAVLRSTDSKADANARGLMDMTPLVLALRQLDKTPDQQAVLPVLLQAGADPNRGTAAYEVPLEMALQSASRTGPAPVALLLKAGAKPNAKTAFGTPVWFTAAGFGADPQMLQLLLQHGADLRASGRGGETALIYAATARNWAAVRWLLDHGADPQQGRSGMGKSLRDLVDDALRERDGRAPANSADDGLQAVAQALARR
jgi:hypothetical protein